MHRIQNAGCRSKEDIIYVIQRIVNTIANEAGCLLLIDGDVSSDIGIFQLFVKMLSKTLRRNTQVVFTIGNHEFDFGLDNMARLFKMANFPIVCANYDVTGTVLEGLVKEYTVIERDGIRIGVFGLGPELDGLVAHANYGNVKFEDPVSEGQRVADLLKNQEHCDLVICLSHLGWKGEPYSDIELIENTRNIDIVLGGHSHSFFEVPEFYKNLDGIEVPVQQMGKSAAFVGRMVVKMQKN